MLVNNCWLRHDSTPWEIYRTLDHLRDDPIVTGEAIKAKALEGAYSQLELMENQPTGSGHGQIDAEKDDSEDKRNSPNPQPSNKSSTVVVVPPDEAEDSRVHANPTFPESFGGTVESLLSFRDVCDVLYSLIDVFMPTVKEGYRRLRWRCVSSTRPPDRIDRKQFQSLTRLLSHAALCCAPTSTTLIPRPWGSS
jgi:hypothetical protein